MFNLSWLGMLSVEAWEALANYMAIMRSCGTRARCSVAMSNFALRLRDDLIRQVKTGFVNGIPIDDLGYGKKLLCSNPEATLGVCTR